MKLIHILFISSVVLGMVFSIPFAYAEEGESMRVSHPAASPVQTGPHVYIPHEATWDMSTYSRKTADEYNLTISGSSPVLTSWSEEDGDWKTVYSLYWSMDTAPPVNTKLLIVETSDNGQNWYTNGTYYEDNGDGTYGIPQEGNTQDTMMLYGVGCKYYSVIVVDSNNGAVSNYSNYLQICTQDASATDMLFPDVPNDYTFYEHIKELNEEGIISGFYDGYFRPEFPVTRAEMAKFIRLALTYTVNTSCDTSFSDIFSSHEFHDDIKTLACEGVINGYEDGTYRGGNAVTRAETAKFIIVGLEQKGASLSAALESDSFVDVPGTHVFHEVILQSKSNGIISGYGDGFFRPDQNTSRGAMSKMINIARKKIAE